MQLQPHLWLLLFLASTHQVCSCTRCFLRMRPPEEMMQRHKRARTLLC